MTKRMVLEFSGWIEADPDKTFFQYTGEMAATKAIISGTEFMSLSEKQQDDYILECLGQAYEYSLDGELNDLHIEIEEPIQAGLPRNV